MIQKRKGQHYSSLRRNNEADRMNLSFAGCGFLCTYYIGVGIVLKKYVPHLLNKMVGASAGAIIACFMLCGVSIEDSINNILHIIRTARKHVLGCFSPYVNIQHMLLVLLQKLLPDDAHIRVNGKLHISLTRVYDMKNVIISQFDSREDLIQALLATSFVPVFSGYLPPKYRDIRYMDGALSNNLSLFDEDTITISPFCGEIDICPRDFSAHLFDFFVSNMSVELSQKNVHRLIQAFLPPKIEILLDMCQQGHDDALKFLHCRNLLKLNRIYIHNKSEFILLIDYGINTTRNNNDKILELYKSISFVK